MTETNNHESEKRMPISRRDFLRAMASMGIAIGLGPIIASRAPQATATQFSDNFTVTHPDFRLYFPYVQATAAQFLDNFNRGDGAVGNGWIGPSWTLVGGIPVYTPTLTERATNPGAEGTYIAGLAPDWSAFVHSGTRTEENTIIHGGRSAEHLSTNREFIGPNTAGVLTGKSYYSKQWVRYVSGEPYLKIRYVDATFLTGSLLVDTPGSYLLYENIFTATKDGAVPIIDTGGVAEVYVDDFHLYEFDPKGRFLVHPFSFPNITVSAKMTYVPWAAHKVNNQMILSPGIIVSLDDPDNPLNYVMAYYDVGDTALHLIKVVNGEIINLSTTTQYAPDGDLIEIRKNGTTYQLFHHGEPMDTNQTISDDAILAGKYAGLYGVENNTSIFSEFIARPYNAIYPPTKGIGSYTTATYPNGNGILSLRFDDGRIEDYTLVYPLLTARNLVGGFAVIRNKISSHLGTNINLAQIKTMQASGMEIMCHSYSHSSDPVDYTAFTYETANAVEEMRLLGLNIDSFVQPGTWQGHYHTLMKEHSFFGTPEDALMREYYYVWEGYLQAAGERALPILDSYRWGASHNTGDSVSLINLKASLDGNITNHRGIEYLFHSGIIGASGYISVADFTAFLDYVKSKVDAGLLTVLTPTQQLFATPV